MERKINTIIFDLDGTLLDTLADLTGSVNYVMKLLDYPAHSMEQVRQMVGNGIGVLMERALPEGRANPDYAKALEAFQTHYAAHMQEETGPFPGIMELLKRLKQEGFLLAVVSNKFDAAVKSLCRAYFENDISVAIGESSTVAKKPAPDTVFEAMKELGVTGDTCVYVGDSEVDIQTAENAGIPCISVNWGFKDTDFLKNHNASVIVSDTRELYQSITGILET